MNLPNSGIHAMMQYAAKYKDVISLGQGTPTFATPQFIFDGVTKRAQIDQSVGMYAAPSMELELKKLIATEMKQKYGFSADTEELVITSGGVAGLVTALAAFISTGDEVLYFDPSYPIHLSQLHIFEGTPVFVPYKENEQWRFPIEEVEQSITPHTKVILLTNPNNPTGTALSRQEVEKLAEIVLGKNLILILDEAYEYLTYDTELYSPMKIEKLRERTILVKSYSKEYALTGWRIGYTWAPKEIAVKLKSIHTYFNIAAPTPAIVAAITALTDPQGETFVKKTTDIYKQSRQAMCERLKNLPKLFSFYEPSGAYYVFPKILIPENALVFAQKLVDEVKVITIPGDSMGPSGKNHLRMSFCIKPETIHTAFDRIDTFAKTHGYV